MNNSKFDLSALLRGQAMASSQDPMTDDEKKLELVRAIKEASAQPQDMAPQMPESKIPDAIRQYMSRKPAGDPAMLNVPPMIQPDPIAPKMPMPIDAGIEEAAPQAPMMPPPGPGPQFKAEDVGQPEQQDALAGLLQAQNVRDRKQLFSANGSGKLALANSVPGFILTRDDLDRDDRQNAQPVQDFKDKQNALKENSALKQGDMNLKKGEMDLKKGETELANEKDLNDATSGVSLQARMIAKQLMGSDVPENLTAAQLNKLLPGIEQKASLDFKREDMKQRALDRQLQRDLSRDQMKMKSNERKEKDADDSSAGQKAVDKDYAKSYNTFTQKGATNAQTAISNLDKLANEMESDTGLGEAGGGRIASLLPDAARSRDAIRRRDQARNFANTTLKELFGGQLSDAEREAAAKEYYNDSLDNATNSKILRGKISQLKDSFKTEEAKAKYYEDKGTLKGFKGITNPSVTPGKASKPKTVMQNGHTYTLNEATGEYE